MDFNLKLKKPAGKKLHTSRKLSSLIGADFGSTAVKIVRIKKEKEKLLLVDAALLPPVDFHGDPVVSIPRSMKDRYIALCSTLPESQVRVFAHTVDGEYDLRKLIRSKLNVSDEFRVNGAVLTEQRKEHSILGVAVPEESIRRLLNPFSEGSPAPCALEVSGLAASAAFFMNHGAKTASRTVCLIDLGATTLYISFFFHNRLQIVNCFDVGAARIVKAVSEALSLDADLSVSLLMDGAVNVSSILSKVLSPILRQLPLLKEFAERKHGSPLSGVYLSGGLASAPAWQSLLKESMGVMPESWNPFEKLGLPEGGLPESVRGQESRFASAVGMALAELGES